MIRAVIFDMFETLVSLFIGRTYFSENIREDLQNAGVSLDEFRGAWHKTEIGRSRGEYTLGEGLAESLRMIGYGGDATKPYDEAKIEEAVELVTRKRLEALGDTFSNIPDATVNLLRDLKERGYKIGLISNCFSDECKLIKESKLFPYFDAVRLSYEFGVCKPDPVVYTSIIEELGVEPGECLYVGDGGSKELFAARSVGMKAAQALWFRGGMFEPHFPSPIYGQFDQLKEPADVLAEAAKPEYEITNTLTAEEYMAMRRAVGWREFPLDEAEDGIQYSAYVCCLRDGGKPIGLSRVLWDHGYVVYIADVIVMPEYQGHGIGRELMNHTMDYIKKEVLKNGRMAMVSLSSAMGKEEFYQRFGFENRPSESTGHGMCQWMQGETK